MKDKTIITKNAPKRMFLVLALAVALVFSFGAIAGAAEYKGFSPLTSQWGPVNPNTGLPQQVELAGFVSWDTARAAMTANAGSIETGVNVGTVHGGYVTSTTKCTVCHSVHRATGIPTGTPGFVNGNVNNQLFLTAADGGSCTTCHTDWGSGSSALLVEWAQEDPGPHDTVGSCGACHRGGIHGRDTSRYHVMNVFMLGGGTDGIIDDEYNVSAQTRGTGWNWSGLSGNVFNAPAPARGATPENGALWWANGGTSPAGMGLEPTGVNQRQFSAARSMATGVTCGQAGCHVYSAFANNIWGASFTRPDPDNPGQTIELTGHVVPGLGVNQGVNTVTPATAATTSMSCGPCHPSNTAGLPTTHLLSATSIQWRQFGCNQCHDMVGVATSSIAFPHGNRNIDVFEWSNVAGQAGANAFTAIEMTTVDEGNLWMYAATIARRAGAGASSAMNSTGQFANTEWRVLTGVTSGTFVAGTTGLTDGACLKCHLPADSQSLEAMGAHIGPQGFTDVATWGTHGFNAARYPGGVASFGQHAGQSMRIHLYR
ncbi:MAG: hypothetical protein FWC81_02460 [Coriobacteriia bacterium]|nr:hypothetical protein [Coriobacteriia bacterium]